MNHEDYLTAGFVEEMRNKYFRNEKLDKISRDGVVVMGIDLQRYFLEPGFHAYLSSSPELLSKLKIFYRFSIYLGVPLILTKHCHEYPTLMADWWSSEMPCAESSMNLHHDLVGFSDDVIVKKTYDSFYETELERTLKNLNVKTLIITGVMTHLCCETTAREAFVRGFNVIFPIDGTLTQNRELHEGTIRAMSHGFAPVPTLEDVMQWMQR